MKRLQHLTLTFLLFFIVFGKAQTKPAAVFGQPTLAEQSLSSYKKDPDAAGVVLYEKADYHVEEIDNYIRLIKQVHVRMKVFDAKRFDQTEVFIPFYTEKNSAEKVTEIKAVTINGAIETYVNSTSIYTTDETENWKLKRFTFSNVQDGSILEYTYRIVSPYFSHLEGWDFQGPIPKLYSEVESRIPGNFLYKRELLGALKLDVNDTFIKKNCFYLEALPDGADCDVGIYAMYDVPAFKEERYMLASKNYSARIKYELKETMDLRGSRTYYTKTWDDVDKEFKGDRDFGRQLKNTGFFEDKIPSEIKQIKDPLSRAKAVFYFIQDHFSWNGNYRIFSDIRVRDAFEERKGNNTEINLSLINALESVGLDAKVMLISTRENGVPSSSYPVRTDFNFAIAVVTIGDERYLLDATDKEAAFNILPFRDLNVKGRVMDFKKGSYWLEIKPNGVNTYYVSTQLAATDGGFFEGNVNELATGHIAAENRKELAKETKTGIAKKKENDAIEISNFNIENVTDFETPFKLSYDVSISPEDVGSKTYFYPFFFDTYFSENPFKLKDRTYPIDIGFPITNTYLISIDLNSKYSVSKLPENKSFKLPQDVAECSVVYLEGDGKINIRFTMNINVSRLVPEAYQVIKPFFENVISIQSKDPIVLERN